MEPEPRRPVIPFFVLTFALAIPVMVLGLVVPPVPGTPKNIPVTDFALTFLPMTAAMILIGCREGAAGVRALARRAVDWRRISGPGWIVVIVATMPVITLASFAVAAGFGVSTAAPSAPAWWLAPVLFALFLVMATGEELGWMGYAMDAMRRRWGALGACVLFSIPWTLGHVPSILLQGKSWVYIGVTFCASIGLRVIWLWVYGNNGGSVFAVSCLHALANVMGTYFMQQYDVVATVLAAAVITLVWGAATLTRQPKPARPSQPAARVGS